MSEEETLCECDRPDLGDDPHRHIFSAACIYWIAGRPSKERLIAAANKELPLTGESDRSDLSAEERDIEWDIDANLPLYTRDWLRYLNNFIAGYRIGDTTYHPDDVTIIRNVGPLA